MSGLLVIPEDASCKSKSRNAYAPLLRKIGKKNLNNLRAEVEYLTCKESMLKKKDSPWFFTHV